jgi:two-component system chemotaxis response regulator CheB
MPRRDLVVIGASAGGIEVLRALLAALPRELPASIFVAIHLADELPSQLAAILDRAGPLPVSPAVDGAVFAPGHVYVARPGAHLALAGDRIRLRAGPRENGFRPSVDWLFRSAALVHGPRVIGLILSGMRDDGAAGLALVKKHGGLALVQDPADAQFDSMPVAAIQACAVDHVLPAAQLPRILVAHAGEPVEAASPLLAPREEEVEEDFDPLLTSTEEGILARTLACPGCGGILQEVREHDVVRYRCRVGHLYSPESLVSEQGIHVEQALWAALNALTERRDLTRRLGSRARERGLSHMATRCERLSGEAERHAASIRRLLSTNAAEVGPRPDAEVSSPDDDP